MLVVTGEDGARSVRILNLGLLKLTSGHEQLGLTPLAVATAEGVTVGTPRYMAPEQARGSAVDARADLYAVGALLYRLLAGRDPFAHHASVGPVLAALLHEAPPAPRTFAPELDPAIEREVLRALAKRPDERHATADELAEALRRAVPVNPLGAQETTGAKPHASWTNTVGVADSELDSGRVRTTVQENRAMAEPPTAPVRVADATRPPMVTPATSPPPHGTDIPTRRVNEPPTPGLDGAAAPAATRRTSGARSVGVFVGSWLGVMLVTVLVLMATRSCSRADVSSRGGAPHGERVSTR